MSCRSDGGGPAPRDRRPAGPRAGRPGPVVLALLAPTTELPRYLADPSSLADELAERAALHARFAAVEPRFFISSQSEVPSIEELEAEQSRTRAGAATPGTVLAGSAGSQTLPQILHLPYGLVVFAVVLMALGGFYGAGLLESRFGGRERG